MKALEAFLKKSKELRDEATPGPWHSVGKTQNGRGRIWRKILTAEPILIIAEPPINAFSKNPKHVADFDFIAHARNTDEAKDEIIRVLSEELKDIATDSVTIGWRAERALDRANELAKKATT